MSSLFSRIIVIMFCLFLSHGAFALEGIDSASGSPLPINAGGNNVMNLLPTGEVLIGSTKLSSNDDLDVAGNFKLDVTGNIVDKGAGGLLYLGASNWFATRATAGAIITDNSGYKALMIVGNNITGNGGLGREVKILDYLNVQGALHTTGAAKFDGKVTVPILPVDDTDAASKAYVDNMPNGDRAWFDCNAQKITNIPAIGPGCVSCNDHALCPNGWIQVGIDLCGINGFIAVWCQKFNDH